MRLQVTADIFKEPFFVGHQDAQRKLIIGDVHGVEASVDHCYRLERHIRCSGAIRHWHSVLSQCEKGVTKEQLVIDDGRGKPGWNFDRLACPDGHKLLVVERMHLLVRR